MEVVNCGDIYLGMPHGSPQGSGANKYASQELTAHLPHSDQTFLLPQSRWKSRRYATKV